MKGFPVSIAVVGLISLIACETKTTSGSGATADSVIITDSGVVSAPVARGSGASIGQDSSGPATGSGPAPSCGGKSISTDRVGGLRLGMTVDDVKKSCAVVRDTTMRGTEGMMERRLVVSFPPDALDAEIVDEKVWRLDIRSGGFRTADGLGVGSPIGDLSRLGRLQGLVGEGVLVVVSPDRCGLSFVLSGGIPGTRVRNWDSTALARLPRSTRVQRVYVVGCPASE